MASGAMPSPRTTSSLRTVTPPLAIAPIAGWGHVCLPIAETACRRSRRGQPGALHGATPDVLPVGLPARYVADSLAARTNAHILRPVSPSRLSPWERQGGATSLRPAELYSRIVTGSPGSSGSTSGPARPRDVARIEVFEDR